ncbi:uncharacterized protein LOC143276781 [Babylonia areolata]|uniref:uncharacterized protein LOC143276781 n=1 Tax=Babylonia areolata TaxID=304850 RepID=UPI003FCF5506
MAAPRKKKKAPPFDVTGIDFSVITTALETGGKMIEQIINGIQYGSPEVRLLMLEECDFILECRVCRGLFRALPNFIAHKRVYCCRAYSDFVHDSHFQSATTVVPPPEQVVVVEPVAPEDVQPKNLRQPRPAKEKGKEQKKDKAGTDPATKKTGKAPSDSSKGNGKQPGSHPLDAGSDKSGTKTRAKQSEESVDRTVDSFKETVHQIESGQLGKSQEYAFYTAAAEKAEKDKRKVEQSAAIHFTAIPTTPCAVFVNKGSLPSDPPVLESASSQSDMVPGRAELRDKEPMKNSPREGSTPAIGQEYEGTKTTTTTESTVITASSLEQTKKTSMSKAAIRSVTKVVKELRQKKEQHTAKEQASQKEKAQKNTKKNSKSILLSILSESKIAAPFPSVQRSEAPADTRSLKEKPPLTTPSPTPSTRSTDQISESEADKEGSLRAVVKRCLTGRPGSVRVSPHKHGDWNADADNVSEAGSYSDRGEAPSPLVRQDSGGDQSAMDMDNLRCTVCNKEFAARKSLMYHCQSRHSGQRTIFPCPYCPRVFYYFWGLTRHLNMNHKKTRSDIDRMRKSLRRKAYKQNIIEEHVIGTAENPVVVDMKDKKETPRKFRPSVHAKKMVAASISSPTDDVKKSPPNTLYMPSRRRRVEVITSVKSKSKKPANLYKKVYANKRTESPVSSPTAVNPLSSPFRTRKLVAKALRTTRSKRVYNRTAIDSPPATPEKVTKKTNSKATKAQSSTAEQNPNSASTPKLVDSDKVSGKKDERKEPKDGMSAAVHKDVKTDCEKATPHGEDSKVHNSAASGPSKPAACSSTQSPASRDKTLGDVLKKNGPPTEAKSHPQTRTQDKTQVDTFKKNEPLTEARSNPQTRTRTSSGVSDMVATTPSCSGLNSHVGPKVSRAAVAKEISPQVVGQRRSGTKVSTRGPASEASGLLHICPHCHRAFGRKISLDSHIKICSKGPVAAPEAAQKQQVQALQLTQKSIGKKIESLVSRASLSRTGKVHDDQTHTRTLRDSSAEQMPRLQKSSANLQESKSNSKRSSSRESSLDRQVTCKDILSDIEAVERPSRSRKKADSKASSSRDSSVDSVRTRRSDSKPVRRSAERTCTLRRESESSGQESLRDSRNRASSSDKISSEENLLVISRQRLSQQLLAATANRDKDPSPVRPRTDRQRCNSSGDALSDSKKSDPVQSSVTTSSLEKSISQRTVTTSVLRKVVKGKLPDSPKKPSIESLSGTSASSSSPFKQDVANPKTVLPEKAAVKPVLSEKSATKPVLQETSAVVRIEIKKADSSSAQLPPPAQGVQISVEPVSKSEQSAASYAPKAAAGSVPPSGKSPQENPSELNQRPRRKRRAPARVLDSEITLPKSTVEKKKGRHDPVPDHGEVKEDLNTRTASSREQTSSTDPSVSMVTKTKDSQDTDRQTVEEAKVEKKTGRPTERARSRIYVVEPSHAGRLTCQDTRKVEEIVNETGLNCLHCNQLFTSVSNLRRHAIRHLGWKRFKCRLCRFCSYNRSECNTHIIRTHFERVRLGSSGARIDTFITDLNRQAASVRSLKKRQTLNRQRQGEGGKAEDQPYTHMGSSGRKAQVAAVSQETTADKAEGSSSAPESSSNSTPTRRPTTRGKVVEVTTASSDPLKNKPPNTTTFNISTRNSPRNFDTRPYSRDSDPAMLNTRKGAYAKRNLSSFAQNLSQAVAEESKKSDTGSENQLTDQVNTKTAVIDSSSSSSDVQSETAKNTVESVTDSPVSQDGSSVKNRLEHGEMGVDQEVEQLSGRETMAGVEGEKKSVASAGIAGSTEIRGKEEEKSDFVMRKREDSDLMDVEELKTLPEHFMSDDDD